MSVNQARHRATISAIAEILREERERKGLSMNAVATEARLSQQMVSYVEREMRNPTLETILRIADAIGIDVLDLIRAARERAAKRRR